eukprot:TRINITY_DN17128_c0_g1_i1.p1 TRINITY_DN17128_c0_g1~~TRINITY_DN17128_c0_g1_i1.p1  ORF type:complete len:309 (-),score=81.13 TRINITY_DN17128_c0_g1_i1:63-950(-)
MSMQWLSNVVGSKSSAALSSKDVQADPEELVHFLAADVDTASHVNACAEDGVEAGLGVGAKVGAVCNADGAAQATAEDDRCTKLPSSGSSSGESTWSAPAAPSSSSSPDVFRSQMGGGPRAILSSLGQHKQRAFLGRRSPVAVAVGVGVLALVVLVVAFPARRSTEAQAAGLRAHRSISDAVLRQNEEWSHWDDADDYSKRAARAETPAMKARLGLLREHLSSSGGQALLRGTVAELQEKVPDLTESDVQEIMEMLVLEEPQATAEMSTYALAERASKLLSRASAAGQSKTDPWP